MSCSLLIRKETIAKTTICLGQTNYKNYPWGGADEQGNRISWIVEKALTLAGILQFSNEQTFVTL